MLFSFVCCEYFFRFLQNSRSWQQRRVACTDNVLAIAHVNGEKLLDAIPLIEILGVQEMGGLGTADLDDGAGRILLDITLTDRFSDNFFSKMVVGSSDSDLEEKEKFRLLFDAIDTDKTGTCSRDELTIFMKKLFYDAEEIENFIQMADSDQDGGILSF